MVKPEKPYGRVFIIQNFLKGLVKQIFFHKSLKGLQLKIIAFTVQFTIMNIFNELNWELLPFPLLTTRRSGCFSFVSRSTKKRYFQSLNEVKHIVNKWVRDIPFSFFKKGISNLKYKWKKCRRENLLEITLSRTDNDSTQGEFFVVVIPDIYPTD